MQQRSVMMRAPSDVEQFLAKAAEAACEGRAEDARKFARRAVSLNPDHPGAQLHWAVELIDRPQQARYHLRRAAELGRGDPAIEYQVACVLFDLGDVDAALMLARRARRHIDDEFRFMPGLVNLTGRLADASGHAEVAERALGLAFALEPEMAWHGRTLSQFLYRDGRAAEALRVTRAALRYTPDDPGLLSLQARLRAAGAV
jgi:tetratricopeptide (TPR) repeat protein